MMESKGVLLKGFREYQKGCGLSEGTILRNYYRIRKFLTWISGRDIREVNRETVFSYRKYLETHISHHTGKKLSEVTIGVELSVLKAFFDYLLTGDFILKNPLEGMRMRKEGIRKLRPIFSEEEMETFLDSISLKNSSSLRDRALFELMYSSGLRVSGILNLEIENINLDERILLIKQGKGKKDRYVPFCSTARSFLLKYITEVRKDKKVNTRYLFRGEVGSLNYGKLRERFNFYLSSCGLEGKGFTMHSIRHATATHLLAHGASIRYVQELLGHEDLKTTQLYTRPSEDNIRRVYRTYHPRENEYHNDVTSEYLIRIEELKDRIEWGEKRATQYRELGHCRGIGRWRSSTG
ncbi:MAG: tyrosine-type recombinase/integrase [bacterium]|nr:tyrosine-type recombinase/integrase [bacterium]